MGALAGAAGLSRVLPGCGSDGGVKGISTWVFMMMENRSYDHYFGARSLLEDKLGNGLVAGMSNLDTDGNAVAIWESTDETMCVVDPPHSWDRSRQQLNSGSCDGFVLAYQQATGGTAAPMQYQTRRTLPVSWALADAYTSCDRWFCSLLGPTLPNRMYWHAGTSNGAKDNDTVIAGAFEGIPSIYHRLRDAGIEWAYYFGDAPVLGVLEQELTEGRIRRLWWDFFDDAAAGKLPPVVYIDPAFARNDDHPPHHPGLGQQLISAVYTALATSPQWNNCNLLLTYDEHGGFFDHVAPPTAPDDRAAEGFDQLGFRVPALMIGPYARPGHVSSWDFDHTSALRHIETLFDLEPLSQRDATAIDLTDLLDADRLERGEPAPPIELPAVDLVEDDLGPECSGSSFRTDGMRKWVAQIYDMVRQREPDLVPADTREQIYGIADYLDRHGRGRIRR